MVTDLEKELLQAWRTAKIAADLENLKCRTCRHDYIHGAAQIKIYQRFFQALEQIKGIKDKQFARLIAKVSASNEPTHGSLKKWKARKDAAEEKLSDAILVLLTESYQPK
jgi:hypothetical protein